MGTPTTTEDRLAIPASAAIFTEEEVDGLPEPVRRYFLAAIAPGTPLARATRLTMRGRIKLGRWLPFRAHEILAPLTGFVWRARVAGLLVGSDRYADGEGGMDWRLGGVVPVMRAAGADIDRSAAARGAVEGQWLPTALLPRFGVEWSAPDAETITAVMTVDETRIEMHLTIDDRGDVHAWAFTRWGDPDATGAFGWHPCGGEVTAHRRFGPFTIPSAGRFGWHYGTARWPESASFRYEVTTLEPILTAAAT